MLSKLFHWGVKTALTPGHPLRWLGVPAMRPFMWCYMALYRLNKLF